MDVIKMIFYKKALILIFLISPSVYGGFAGKTFLVVEKCKTSDLNNCQANYLINQKNHKKLLDLNDKDHTNELYLKFEANGKGSIYYTYSAEGSIDQEWRDFSYGVLGNKLNINVSKNAYIIDSLLNADNAEPFLNRRPFSYISNKAKIIGFGNKEQALEYDISKIIYLNVYKDYLVLSCQDYLKINHYESPITKLCDNKRNNLILRETK